MNTPPPPTNSEALADGPKKKPWSKPTILRIEDGVLETEAGSTNDPTWENPTYRSSS